MCFVFQIALLIYDIFFFFFYSTDRRSGHRERRPVESSPSGRITVYRPEKTAEERMTTTRNEHADGTVVFGVGKIVSDTRRSTLVRWFSRRRNKIEVLFHLSRASAGYFYGPGCQDKSKNGQTNTERSSSVPGSEDVEDMHY